MQRIKRLLIALCLVIASVTLAAAQGNSASQGQNMFSGGTMQKSLFERLGGLDAISAVTDEFIKNAAADTRINAKFGKTDIPRLRFHLIEQLCAATGGPCTYTGRSMKQTHKNMKVTEGEFNALVEDLVKALDKFNVPQAEKNELLGILGPLKDQIVEVKGNATGTPLPGKFKAAKPLPEDKIKAGPTKKSGMGH